MQQRLCVPLVPTSCTKGALSDAVPDMVKAKAFHVVGKDGAVLVKLEDAFGLGLGHGTVTTLNGKGRDLVELGAAEGDGTVKTLNGKGQDIVTLGATVEGEAWSRP